MKPTFKLEKFPGKYAMCCKTREEAKIFQKFLHDSGRTWSNGDDYLKDELSNSFWTVASSLANKLEALYYFNEGCYAIRPCPTNGYTILKFSDFNWEKASNYNKANKYQKAALRTNNIKDKKEQLINGLMGLNGEAGECIDILKKHMFQGHGLDEEHLIEELGDVAWYLAVSADALNVTLSEVFEKNIAKLKKRYPDGFNAERSVCRESLVENNS